MVEKLELAAKGQISESLNNTFNLVFARQHVSR
jgi:hypothetical protein